MARHKLILGLIACLGIGLLAGRSLSQTRGGYRSGSGFGGSAGGSGGSSGGMATSSRSTVASKQASLKGAVGATDEQWVAIEPKLEKVRQLQRTASVGIMISSGGGGGGSSWGGTATGSGVRGGARAGDGSGIVGSTGTGSTNGEKQHITTWMRWKWYKSWGSNPPQRDDEKQCDALFSLLKDGNANPDEIRQRMDALSKAREQRKDELIKARTELRELLTLDQEARLVALGWLD